MNSAQEGLKESPSRDYVFFTFCNDLSVKVSCWLYGDKLEPTGSINPTLLTLNNNNNPQHGFKVNSLRPSDAYMRQ